MDGDDEGVHGSGDVVVVIVGIAIGPKVIDGIDVVMDGSIDGVVDVAMDGVVDGGIDGT